MYITATIDFLEIFFKLIQKPSSVFHCVSLSLMEVLRMCFSGKFFEVGLMSAPKLYIVHANPSP